NFDGITPDDEDGTLTAEHRFSRFNPAAGITIHPGESLSAYLGYSQGSRAPSAIELGCSDPENPCRLPNAMAGDPPLDQVVTHTIELGVRGREPNGLAWNIGLFSASNRDDIMFVADDAAGLRYLQNFGETVRQGIELGLRTSIGRKFDFGANYTFLDATYQSEETVAGEGNSSNEEGPGFEGTIDIEVGSRIPLVPRNIFKTFAEWRVGSK